MTARLVNDELVNDEVAVVWAAQAIGRTNALQVSRLLATRTALKEALERVVGIVGDVDRWRFLEAGVEAESVLRDVRALLNSLSTTGGDEK